MLFLLDFADAAVLADGQAFRIVRQADRRQAVDDEPDALRLASRVADDFRGALAVLFLHSLPGRGRFVDMAIGGYQFEIWHGSLLIPYHGCNSAFSQQ